jgi:hypothetical protein
MSCLRDTNVKLIIEIYPSLTLDQKELDRDLCFAFYT